MINVASFGHGKPFRLPPFFSYVVNAICRLRLAHRFRTFHIAGNHPPAARAGAAPLASYLMQCPCGYAAAKQDPTLRTL